MSETPKSDAALEQWPVFTGEVYERLENGKRTYGDSSFERPLTRLIVEIQQELMDQAGWSFILWKRLEDIKSKVAVVEVANDTTQPASGVPRIGPGSADHTRGS